MRSRVAELVNGFDLDPESPKVLTTSATDGIQKPSFAAGLVDWAESIGDDA
ncbi:hypothetical protein RISK_000081 [Rhodopirellula islandica]|uniref:Uncharacterized protein n=1 Tax=Rhodopirellula islandica TaxID=595434 RepID=A0A0J1BN57_RHOIS|nr:hypothetical protein RISK_000081 [Rhodopirellula islandica]